MEVMRCYFEIVAYILLHYVALSVFSRFITVRDRLWHNVKISVHLLFHATIRS